MKRAGFGVGLVLLSLLSLPGRAAEPVPGAPSPAPPLTAEAVKAELDAGRVGSAVVLCEEAERDGRLAADAKTYCGKALDQLGDKLAEAGSPDNARKRWIQAAGFDPRLLDDPAFVKKLSATSVARPDRPRDPEKPRIPTKPVTPSKPKVTVPPTPKTPPGARYGRSLGLGLSFGFDGVVALDLGWLVDEQWLVEVAFGVIYPTTDVRFRWLGMRHCVTPYIGLGLLVPFGSVDRFGLSVSGFESLYELGEAVHVDLGLAYTPVHSLDLYAGMSFLTPFDQDHPDTVVFFPQFSAGASWYF